LTITARKIWCHFNGAVIIAREYIQPPLRVRRLRVFKIIVSVYFINMRESLPCCSHHTQGHGWEIICMMKRQFDARVFIYEVILLFANCLAPGKLVFDCSLVEK
jgi:hypothetical protein